ncbi:MAG: histone deacetylase family protein [Ilumatobacteraceae bacterium]|nr:histone deacetylase family protein [Ilumatobacteraceae bacterium]
MKVVYTPAHLLHNPSVEIEKSTTHSPFENISRAEKIREVLSADTAFDFISPTQWGTAPINAVHDPGLLRFLTTAWSDYQRDVGAAPEVVPDMFYRPAQRRGMSQGQEPDSVTGKLGWWCFETTTPLTSGTYEAARGAVDTALTATQLVLSGDKYSYGLCRPPGHHATSSLYGGYCFFNNAAIAAHHIATTTGTKVAVLDVDYHHGNGTQEIFYDREDVLYVSLHGDPNRAYPYYLGHADETGTGKGARCNFNVPLPARTDDDAYLLALEPALEKIIKHGAQTIIVSLGLDTFITDPICDLSVTTQGFRRCGSAVAQLGLPTIVLQEGGYDVAKLGDNVQAWLHGLSA